MSDLSNLRIPERRVSALHPKFAPIFQALENALSWHYNAGTTRSKFEIYETFRTSEREKYLLMISAVKPAERECPHCNGLAADFVPFVYKGACKMEWDWGMDHDWDLLRDTVLQFPDLEQPVFGRPTVVVKNWKQYEREWNWIA